MKNTRLCKVWSKRHVPADLWPEILSRLPVKSLLRFRCVSKSWRSLVDDAEFARLHLNNFKNNRDETHLLVVQGRRRKCVMRCSVTFKTNSETPLVTLGDDCRRDEIWDIVCCVDGLILLKLVTRKGGMTGSDVLKLWNPSIRKFREIPTFPENEASPNRFFKEVDIGLGYDPLAKDYKLVELIFGNYNTLHSVAIYSLGGGSWKTIKFQGRGSCSNWRWQQKFGGTVYLHGSLYFIARDAHNRWVSDLVSFDLSSEVFSSVGMPDYPDFRCTQFIDSNEPALIDGGCSLAVIDRFSRDKSVWVLESCSGESGSMHWTKRWSFRLESVQFLYMKKNGDILTRRCCETIRAETGRKLLRWDQVELYSPQTDESKIMQQKRASHYMISHVSSYVESLIMHK